MRGTELRLESIAADSGLYTYNTLYVPYNMTSILHRCDEHFRLLCVSMHEVYIDYIYGHRIP